MPEIQVSSIGNGEFAFQVGSYVAYGHYELTGEGGLEHAPTQKDMDAVGKVIDAISIEELAKLLVATRTLVGSKNNSVDATIRASAAQTQRLLKAFSTARAARLTPDDRRAVETIISSARHVADAGLGLKIMIDGKSK